MDGPLQPSPAASAALFHANGVADCGDTITGHGGKDEQSLETLKFSRAIAGMEGGAGEFSYTRNSRIQSEAINILKPILEQQIGDLTFQDWSTIRIADFGCSVGANTLQYAEICFRTVQEFCRIRSSDRASKPSIIQYFFSDLPSNDFNTLFRQVEDWRDSRTGAAEDDERKKLYTAAVPGSFYGRLFPPGILHVAISVLAVQLIPQVPDAVVDRASPAYNKGRVTVNRTKSSAVLEDFSQTARQDLCKFLLARAEEVVSGGLVLLYALGRADDSRPELHWAAEAEYAAPYGVLFEATWEELVVEGIIDEERRDSFNVPVYCHSLDEVRAAAESTNAYDIKRLELKRQSFFPPGEVEQVLAAPEQYGQFMRNFTRSLLNSYIVEHIGEKSTAEFFDRLERNAAVAAREKRMSSLPMDCFLAVLVRK